MHSAVELHETSDEQLSIYAAVQSCRQATVAMQSSSTAVWSHQTDANTYSNILGWIEAPDGSHLPEMSRWVLMSLMRPAAKSAAGQCWASAGQCRPLKLAAWRGRNDTEDHAASISPASAKARPGAGIPLTASGSGPCAAPAFPSPRFTRAVAAPGRREGKLKPGLLLESSFNDGTTQTARDPLLKGGRFAPTKSLNDGGRPLTGPSPDDLSEARLAERSGWVNARSNFKLQKRSRARAPERRYEADQYQRRVHC